MIESTKVKRENVNQIITVKLPWTGDEGSLSELISFCESQ